MSGQSASMYEPAPDAPLAAAASTATAGSCPYVGICVNLNRMYLFSPCVMLKSCWLSDWMSSRASIACASLHHNSALLHCFPCVCVVAEVPFAGARLAVIMASSQGAAPVLLQFHRSSLVTTAKPVSLVQVLPLPFIEDIQAARFAYVSAIGGIVVSYGSQVSSTSRTRLRRLSNCSCVSSDHFVLLSYACGPHTGSRSHAAGPSVGHKDFNRFDHGERSGGRPP